MKKDVYDVDKIFKYHSPTMNDIVNFEYLRAAGKNMALVIIDRCPDSKERDIALTKLDEIIMWANMAIARD